VVLRILQIPWSPHKKSLPTYFLIVLKKNTKVIYNYITGCGPIGSPSIQSRPAGFSSPAWTGLNMYFEEKTCDFLNHERKQCDRTLPFFVAQLTFFLLANGSGFLEKAKDPRMPRSRITVNSKRCILKNLLEPCVSTVCFTLPEWLPAFWPAFFYKSGQVTSQKHDK